MIHRKEEVDKLSKLQREKPLAYEKMCGFSEKIEKGESIAIIRIEYSYACNFRCTHCVTDGFRNRQRILKPSIVRRIAREADELGLGRFVLTGGEPLVFPDLKELIISLMPEKFYVNIDTNGWYLTEVVAQNLKRLGVDRIQLSIDSLIPEEHDKFRNKPGSWERAMEAIPYVRKAGLDLFIQTVVTKSRLYSKEFLQFVEHFNMLGIGVFVTFIKAQGAGEAFKDDMCSKEDFRYFDKLCEKMNLFWHLTPAYGRPGCCPASRGMVSITPWGDVNACLYLHKPIGNVFDDSLKTILERGMKTKPWDEILDTCPAADREWKWE